MKPFGFPSRRHFEDKQASKTMLDDLHIAAECQGYFLGSFVPRTLSSGRKGGADVVYGAGRPIDIEVTSRKHILSGLLCSPVWRFLGGCIQVERVA